MPFVSRADFFFNKFSSSSQSCANSLHVRWKLNWHWTYHETESYLLYNLDFNLYLTSNWAPIETSSVAKCCSIFSVTGFFFLIVIGILLQKQPLYMKGPENPEEAAKGCYEGGMSAPYYDIEMFHSPFIRTCRKGIYWLCSFFYRSDYLPRDIHPVDSVLVIRWDTAGTHPVLL